MKPSPTRPVVALVRTDETKEGLRRAVREALQLVGFTPPGMVHTVAIKPNLCYYWQSTTGCTTDARVVAALIEWLREQMGSVDIKVVESDASAMRTRHSYGMLGYRKLADEYGIDLINLSEDETTEVSVDVNGLQLQFAVPKTLQTVDLVVNVPKLKLARATSITVGLKNNFGCIATSRKLPYHKHLDEAIVGISKIIRPQITIVDGTYALGRATVRLGLLLAGQDVVAVDSVACRVMGVSPRLVRSIRLAEAEGLGASRNIEVRGENIENFRRLFPVRRNNIFYRRVWDFQLRMVEAYCRFTGDILPPIIQEVSA